MDVPKIFGRYEPIKVLGVGAGSRVMLVNDLLDGEVRALKVLMDEAGTEGFFREFEILASIQHPLVIKVFDFGQDASGLRYFTMEKLDGRPLADAVSDGLSYPRITRIAAQILTALAAIHARGILHADLKPQNIFLVEEGEKGDRIKLLDFGLAGLRKDKNPGQRRGTLPYMAPEWFEEGEVDIRSDLYSTGVVLYELLTGTTPFEGLRPEAVIRAKLSDASPTLDDTREDCPSNLKRLVTWLLERDPVTRPQTAADALKVLEDESVAATPLGATSDATILLSGLPLQGRERLMATLQAIREDAVTSSSGRVLFFLSDAGGGKSRILHEIKCYCQREGQGLIEARGGDQLGHPPLRQLLYSPVKLEGENHRQLIERYSSVVEMLFSEEGEPHSTARALAPTETLGLVDGAAGFLIELAARQPLMLLLDDLHLADSMTPGLIFQLAFRLSQAPLLLCVTVDAQWFESRDDFKDLAERKDVKLLQLEPLSEPAIVKLLDEVFGQMTGQKGLAEKLHKVSFGNPTMIYELLESLVNAGALFTDRGRWFVSEEGAIDVLGAGKGSDRAAILFKRRLAPLEPVQLELLQAAAVLGTDFKTEALARLHGAESWSEDLLEPLSRHGLLTQLAHPVGHMRFAQPRLQSYLLSQLPPEKGRDIHRRAGELILTKLETAANRPEELADEPLFELASHFLAAAELDLGKSYGLLAASRAEKNLAVRQALELYRQLLNLAAYHELEPPADVRMKIADLNLSLGQTKRALDEYESLRKPGVTLKESWIRRTDEELPIQVDLHAKLAQVYGAEGNFDASLKELDAALPLLPEKDTASRLKIAGFRASFQLNKNAMEAAEQTARQALELAGSSPPQELMVSALELHCILATVHSHRQELAESEEYISKGLKIAHNAPDTLSHQNAREVRRMEGILHFIRGRCQFMKGEFPKALESWVDAVRHFEALRDLNYLAKCYNNIGVAHFQMGEWGEAIDHWERFKDLVERSRDTNELINACVNLGWMYKETGQLDKAGSTFEQGLKLVRRLNLTLMLPTLLGNLGEQRARLGEYDEARRLYMQALQLSREAENQSEEVETLRRLAELSLDEGRLTKVRREVHDGLEVARKTQNRLEEANILAIQGAEAAERSLTERTLACFRQSDEILKDLQSDLERARLKYRQGLSFHKLGFPSESENALRFAEETFRRLGAAWDLKRTREALKKVGSDTGGGGLAFKKLQLLLDATRGLGAEIELEPLLDRILEKAIELAQAERGFVILLDEKGNPTFHSTRQMAREDVEKGESAQISSTVVKKVISSGEPLAVTNVDQEFELRAQESVIALGLRSIMCAPIKRGDKAMGVIYVDSSKITEGFYQADISLLEALADTAAVSLENAQLVTSLRRKTDLMSILAHEFRSPITASITFTQQLQRSAEQLNEEQRESIQAILEQGFRLSRMINNILELARMEADKVEWWMEELVMKQVIDSSVKGLMPLAREKNVDVIVRPDGPDVIVYGNPDRLIQVCTNLLGNSLKFTPERGKVEIWTELTESPVRTRTEGSSQVPAGERWLNRTLGAGKRLSETSFLAVKFADTGPGIPVEDLQRIFGKFAQTGDRSSRAKGTGLGLTIAEEIVVQHGGKMWAENAPSGGAMFVFCLPIVVSA